MYPQAFQSSSLQPGTPTEYDTAPHASHLPLLGPRPPPTESVLIYPVHSTDFVFVRQQSPRQMNLAWSSSQGSVDAWNPRAGSSSHQSISEFDSPYNPGGFQVDCQQNPRPIPAAPPSQGLTGVQNGWVPFSQDYLNCTFLRQPLTEDDCTTMATEKRKALIVRNGQTGYVRRILIPMGIEDWDRLLPTSSPRLQVTTLHCGRL